MAFQLAVAFFLESPVLQGDLRNGGVLHAESLGREQPATHQYDLFGAA